MVKPASHSVTLALLHEDDIAALAAAAGPAESHYLASAAATNNAALVRAGEGRVFTVSAYNTTGGLFYLKLYDKATAPDPAADTPLRTLAINPGPNHLPLGGLQFELGIGYAIVVGRTVDDNTAVADGAAYAVSIDYR